MYPLTSRTSQRQPPSEERTKSEAGVRRQWYACYTRARHEKRVAVALARRGIEAYLPLVARQSQWHDRLKTIQWPLYPGYVFARLNEFEFQKVADIPGVAALVGNEGRPSPIDPVDLDNVRRIEALLAETGEVPVSEPLVKEGEGVLIESGQLAGMRGIVLQRRGSGRVLIQVGLKTIGQGVKLEVDARQLRSLGDAWRTDSTG